jgi:hypothetical protein
VNDQIIRIGAIALVTLVIGGLLGVSQRGRFSFGWLLVAVALVAFNDFLLTNGYHHLPRLLPPSGWNWQGKALALAGTLVIAALPGFGWRKCGLTLSQNRKGFWITCLVAVLTCAVFVALALHLPNEPLNRQTLAYQLTMPGLEEEPFYRGVLLLALNEAFRVRARIFGIQLGWGGVLSCMLFGFAHAFEYAHGVFSLDPMTMAATALPAFILIWMRERTGSLVLPVLLHNFANSVSLLL